MTKSEYRALSGVARTLLGLDETDHHDFKETVKSVTSEDFVAFANTPGGGSLLIGVKEKTHKNGLTKHHVVGCDHSDSAKLSLLEKAHSCRPPVPITIITENLNAAPFLRVTIPESPHKPHCTEKGLYKMRKGPRNAPLVPEHLLDLFLETQGKAFVERFSDASMKIEAMLEEIQKHVQSVTGLIFGEIGELSEQIGRQLQSISDMADTTTGLAEDANADNQTTLEYLQDLDRQVAITLERAGHSYVLLDQMTAHFDLDPIEKIKARETLSFIFTLSDSILDKKSSVNSILTILAEKNPRIYEIAKHFTEDELLEIYDFATRDDTE